MTKSNTLKNLQTKKPLVSIIVPVYNASKYLSKCLDSIVNQTLKNIEIIIINDGSTDNSLEIIQDYASKDERIKVIDKPNSGYGNSMNMGLSTATGEYIGIVESDDFIAENMYEELYLLSQEGEVDIVKGNFFDYYPAKNGETAKAYVNNDRNTTIEMPAPFSLKENPEISWGHPSIWSAIYKREFLIENSIKFLEVESSGWVDNPFFIETICKSKKIVWTKTPYYYYYKANPDSSSNKQDNLNIPFDRMHDILDIVQKNNITDINILKCIYARCLMYVRGAYEEFYNGNTAAALADNSRKLFRRLDSDILTSHFNLFDQHFYFDKLSSLTQKIEETPKILIYNWLPFDNPWGWGGGVTVYCKNIIEQIIKEYPAVNIYFISSGFAYDATSNEIYVRKIGNIFGDSVHQYEIVNSPVPAEQRNIYVNPLVALENEELKNTVSNFIKENGPFNVIHFNNIEGLSLDVLDLKSEFPETKFVFSIHNYVPLCVNGSYYMRHKHCNCNPDHTGEDCFACTRADIRSNIAIDTYNRGLYGADKSKCISQNRWLNRFGFTKLDIDVSPDRILEFAKVATEKINKNCDEILAVSKRVYDIAADNGFDESKMIVSYIGTKVAGRQLGYAATDINKNNGLKIVFLGSDINYEEKGYPFLLDSLKQLDVKYASKIDLVLTVKQAEHAEIYDMLRNFRSIKVIQGYTHDDLEWIFKDCNLSIVPVLWEDNLPQISIESVAYGVPVLSSTAGGASELSESDYFKFECGNKDDLCKKIMHFIDNPEALNDYWNKHNGLVTMKMHCDSLMDIYGIDVSEIEEIGYTIKERNFLHRNISYNDQKLIDNSRIEALNAKLHDAYDLNKKLEKRIKDMERISGKIVFQTTYDPIQGHVGANLFKLTLPDFNYSDFVAEIKFIKLANIDSSMSDTLIISGTWMENDGTKSLKIHQLEWNNNVLNDWIYFFIEENTISFFGRFPGFACGYSYEIISLTSRALHDDIKYEALNNGFIYENQLRNENAFNTLPI